MLIEDPATVAFLTKWNALFGQTPVTARTIALTALEHDTEFLHQVSVLLPDFIDSPQPRLISKWLLRHENFLVRKDRNHVYRFTRVKTTVDGALWRLSPIVEANANAA